MLNAFISCYVNPLQPPPPPSQVSTRHPLEMASDQTRNSIYSYIHNSFLQKIGVDKAKGIIFETILEKLDIKQIFSSSPTIFRIADLGCAAGPNTFLAVENIVELAKLKCQFHGLDLDSLEFQVFFNDLVFNDFNMLFKNLPSDKEYYASGVPGSFHGRLFPPASLHFAYSSYALANLSKVPDELQDTVSPAWNKGKVYFTNSPKEVAEAYTMQFAKDLESFLKARALELVPGGLMAFLFTSVPPDTKCALTAVLDLLGSTLMDLVNMGKVSEEKVDSFNLPLYFPNPIEFKDLIAKNGSFTIERMHALELPCPEVGEGVMHIRAILEEPIKENFGAQIIESLFNQLQNKIAENSVAFDLSYKRAFVPCAVLKRKMYLEND
ncbi:loganic acid O-methyltransferase [Hevea brasiliensis]|nr:loganic acid O-methyltransferase [Hevea brasiliensis]